MDKLLLSKGVSMKNIFVFAALLTALCLAFTFSGCDNAGNSTGVNENKGNENEDGVIPGTPAVPGAPTVTPDEDGFIISWASAEGADSYELLYSESNAAPGPASSGVEVYGASLEIKSSLEPNTDYYVWVRAVNAIAKSAWSETATAKTLNDGYSIISFAINGYAGNISGTTISIMLPHNTDLAALSPDFTVSTGAAPSIASGTERDFSDLVNPLDYVITSENGKRIRTYYIIANLYGSGAFTFAFDDEGEAVLPDEAITIYKAPGAGQSSTYTLTVAGTFTSYQWFVDDLPETITSTSKTFTLDAAKYTKGGHNLSVVVYKGTVPYSCELLFSVRP
jgi:hypothetical protein